MQTVTKSAFANLIGVTPGRVSQYISEGKLSGPAIDGEGPRARIVVEEAYKQLGRSLDPGQLLGRANPSLLSSLPLSPPADAPSVSAQNRPQTDNEVYARARADSAVMSAEKQRRDMALELGIYMLTEGAEAQFAKLAADFLLNFEMMLPDMAAAAAQACGVQDVKAATIALKKKFREWRDDQAAQAAKVYASLPKFLPDPAAAEATSEPEAAPVE